MLVISILDLTENLSKLNTPFFVLHKVNRSGKVERHGCFFFIYLSGLLISLIYCYTVVFEIYSENKKIHCSFIFLDPYLDE